jgi:hypothetical protein
MLWWGGSALVGYPEYSNPRPLRRAPGGLRKDSVSVSNAASWSVALPSSTRQAVLSHL